MVKVLCCWLVAAVHPLFFFKSFFFFLAGWLWWCRHVLPAGPSPDAWQRKGDNSRQ